MIPREAIEKAIEGGWKFGNGIITDAEDLSEYCCLAAIALDPSFWKCLEKALGWDTREAIGGAEVDRWHAEAIHFYWTILTGGDTKAFWDELLTK